MHCSCFRGKDQNPSFGISSKLRYRGPTKRSRTELSEGQSYLVKILSSINLDIVIDSISQNLARDNKFFQHQSEIPTSRIIVEPHATDSYQNVLFSLLQFRLHTGVYPRRVTVVTHEFKRARFVECHFPALGFLPITSRSTAEEISTTERDTARVAVIGINPPEEVTPVESLVRGELKSGIGLWRSDPCGVGPELSAKRRKRGWCPGTEKVSFDGLEDVVLELICWDEQEWFSKMEELPWFGLES